MQLSNVGVIADLMWYEITKHSKNIELGEFVVMPNHIHGILILDNETSVEQGMPCLYRCQIQVNFVFKIKEKIQFRQSLDHINPPFLNTHIV